MGLARQGAKVVVAEIIAENGARVAGEINDAGGHAMFVEVDVSSPESTQAMAEKAVAELGGVDFLVNNAAIFGNMKMESMLKVEWDYYQKFMNVNLNGALLCTRACYKSMQSRGGGAIVNQSSTAAWMGVGYYGLAKHAINGLTHALATELGPRNIRVNAIAPGPTDTQALRNTAGDFAEEMVKQFPLRRIGKPDDMVDMCLFLLSDNAAWVTAQVVNVDGGQIARL
jgi:NAD(P)-dependent dehydrogenase (short-subunit alcohol dehydrogenase family)